MLAALLLAASVPLHVLSWYYYAENGVNAAVPAPVMARYADFAEDDAANDPSHLEAFKHAGGAFAVAYTDPAYVPYCHPPFTRPAGHCEGPIGRALDGHEDAFFHGRDGTRVRRYMDPHFLYQEAFNPKSPAARAAWRAYGEEIVRRAPSIDYFLADDSGAPFHARDMSPLSSWFYDFNDAGTEITSDADFRDAWISYLTAAPRPLIVNGYDPGTGLPAYGGAFLRARGVLGEQHENCFRGHDTIALDADDRWRFEADSLLANTALQRYAVCFMYGRPTPATRLYGLASWWTTYDPRWSVIAPVDPIPGRSAVLPELEIVPRAPVRDPGLHVAALRAENGTYVREFGACYQVGRPIGPCAAVVNPTHAPARVPQLYLRYHHALAVDDLDAPAGHARFTAPVPETLGPLSGAILGP
jgi:hypothetical protein